MVGGVPRAEAGAAEGGLHHGAGSHQIRQGAVLHQLHVHGDGGGVHVQGELPGADGLAPQHVGRLGDAGEGAAGAAADDALLHLELAVLHLVQQGVGGPALADLLRGLLRLPEDVGEVLLQLIDGVGVGGVEGQRNHGLDGGEVDLHAAVVIGHLAGLQLLVIAAAAMLGEPGLGVAVGLPDGGKAGGLGGHHVHAVAVVGVHRGHAGADKLHDLVLHIAVGVHGLADGQGDVVGAHPGLGLAGEVDGHHLWIGAVPGVAQDLLIQLAAALAHGHGAQSAVAGVAVAAQNHLAAAGVHLPHILVDDRHVGGHVDTAVLLGGGEAEHVVVLVDSAAHRAQGVVAAGEHIGHGELLHARGPGRLDDAHIGDVVGGQGVKADLQGGGVTAVVVGLQNAVGDGGFLGLLGGGVLQAGVPLGLGSRHQLAVHQVYAAFVKLYHGNPSFSLGYFSKPAGMARGCSVFQGYIPSSYRAAARNWPGAISLPPSLGHAGCGLRGLFMDKYSIKSGGAHVFPAKKKKSPGPTGGPRDTCQNSR